MTNDEYNFIHDEENKVDYNNELLYNDKYIQNEFNFDHDNSALPHKIRKKLSPLLLQSVAAVVVTTIVTAVVVLLSININYTSYEATQTTLKIDIELENIQDNLNNDYTAVLKNGNIVITYPLEKTEKQSVIFTDLTPYTQYNFKIIENDTKVIYENDFLTKSYFSYANDLEKTVFTIDYSDNAYINLTDVNGNQVPIEEVLISDSNLTNNIYNYLNRLLYDEKYMVQVYYYATDDNIVILEERPIQLNGGKERPQITSTYSTTINYVDEYIDSITIDVNKGEFDVVNNTPVYIKISDVDKSVVIDCGDGFNNTNTFTTSGYLPLDKKEYIIEVYDRMTEYVISKTNFTSNYKRYLVDFIDNSNVKANVDDSIVTRLIVTSPFGEELPFGETNTNNLFTIPNELIYYGTYHVELLDENDTVLESRDVIFNEEKLSLDLTASLVDIPQETPVISINGVLTGTLKELLLGTDYFFKIIDENGMEYKEYFNLPTPPNKPEFNYDCPFYEETEGTIKMTICAEYNGREYIIADAIINSEYKIIINA